MVNLAGSQKLSVGSPALYRIRVLGRVDSSWSDFLHNVIIRASSFSEPSVVTTLTVYLADQSTLAGVLQYIFMLGLPLLQVECLEVVPTASSDMVSS